MKKPELREKREEKEKIEYQISSTFTGLLSSMITVAIAGSLKIHTDPSWKWTLSMCLSLGRNI